MQQASSGSASNRRPRYTDSFGRASSSGSMPDSPVDVKVPARSSATPPAMPPPPAAVAQGAPRASTYTPTAMINGGSSHSPTAASIGGSPSSPPHGYHGPSPSPSSGSSSSSSSLSSSTSSSASLSLSAASTLGQQQQQHHQSQHHHHHHHHNHHSNQQHHHHQQQHHPQQQHHQQPVPAACGARQLSKLKRFLATLQQFGSDISPEIGERVRGLVLGLVNSSVTIEEFHSKLQEATNFPLRPFVIPFLKPEEGQARLQNIKSEINQKHVFGKLCRSEANLPLLQRELLQCARTAKLSPAQYLAQNQFLLLDVGIPPAPPAAPLAPGAGTSSHGGGTMAGSHNHHHHQHHQHHQQHHHQNHHQHHPPHHGTATTPHHHHQQQQQHHHHQQQHQQQSPSPFDSAEPLLEVNENGKRSLSDRGSRENGLGHDAPSSKRLCPPLAPPPPSIGGGGGNGPPLNGSAASSHNALAALASPLAPPLAPSGGGGGAGVAGSTAQRPASSGGVHGQSAVVGLSQPATLYSLGGGSGGHHRRAEEMAHGGRAAHNIPHGGAAMAASPSGLYRDAACEMREHRERHHSLALPVSRPEEVIDHRLTEREWAEEWKHLDHLLSCILEMVEKTRRAISVLRRCQETDRQELARWVRRCCSEEAADPPGASASAGPIGKKNGLGHVAVGGSGSTLGSVSGISKQQQLQQLAPVVAAVPSGGLASTASLLLLDTHQEFLSRPGTRYMPEDIWRKAEEAVNDVKRRAMSELQKAVSDAERQARSTIEGERARMERALADAKRQAASDAIAIVARQDDSSESCWNCGRKASETCSGCNTARYCGAFCQHKDWERHHHVCGQRQQQQQPQKEQHRHHQQQQQQQPKVEPSPQPSADLIVQTAGSVKGGGGGGGGGSSSSSSGGGGGRVGGSPDDGVIAAAVSAPPPPPPRPDSPIVVESAAAASR